MYARIENGEIAELISSLPRSWGNISNFDNLSEEQLSDLTWASLNGSFYKVMEEPPLSYDPLSKKAVQTWTIDVPQKRVIKGWQLVALTEEEIEANEYAEQNETFLLWEEVRKNRNKLLSESDWTQLSDSPISADDLQECKVYRQSLRDITEQEDPRSLSWPTKPKVLISH